MLKLDEPLRSPLKPRGIGEQVRNYFTSRGRTSGILFFQFSRPTIKRQLALLAKDAPGASYQFINYVKAAKGEEGVACGTRGGALTHVPPSCHLVIFYEHLIS